MEEKGLIHALLLDGKGGGRLLDWQDIAGWSPEDGVLWLHLSYAAPETVSWLKEESGLESHIVEVLLSEETRPRATVMNGGMLLTLRGVNLNPGADHEDMVSVRIWAEEKRIITTRRRSLLSITGLLDSCLSGQGPVNSSEFIYKLVLSLTTYIEETVEDIEDQTSVVEEQIMISHDRKLRAQTTELRRETIMLRRYLAPQREAITRLPVEKVHWFSKKDRRHLYETANSLIRIVEDLDSLRERANIAQEELVNILSEQLNFRMYVLSLVTAIFLPLSFVTGLLGINVAGIPGAHFPWAFPVVVGILLFVCFLQFLYFRKKSWI